MSIKSNIPYYIERGEGELGVQCVVLPRMSIGKY